MIIELSTGKKIKLNGKEYQELVEHICKNTARLNHTYTIALVYILNMILLICPQIWEEGEVK